MGPKKKNRNNDPNISHSNICEKIAEFLDDSTDACVDTVKPPIVKHLCTCFSYGNVSKVSRNSSRDSVGPIWIRCLTTLVLRRSLDWKFISIKIVKRLLFLLDFKVGGGGSEWTRPF